MTTPALDPHDEPTARILVIDDERQVSQLLSRFLEKAGYQCQIAADSVSARRLLGAGRFDLILCDIHMPEESGIELIRQVKPLYPNTGVVMVSVIDNPSEARMALELGVYGYIVKPFTRNIVLITVENALRRQALESAQQQYQQQLEARVRERTAQLEGANERLRQRELELSARMKDLEDFNSTLSVLLKKMEADRSAIEESILANTRKLILPWLQRLKKRPLDNRLKQELAFLENGLNELVDPFVQRISKQFSGLTVNEIRVAAMIRQGLTTKEIAEALHLSTNTIMTHRYNIRTKLGLKDKPHSLHLFLKNLSWQ